ncbi:hypothetical protein HDV01_001344 [Terramyces sp. JEL0728]|nr:hypothetical protein HDV01_001344 [Terramyces sp. JEL0728]
MARKRKSRNRAAAPREYTETRADLNNLDLNSEDEFQDQSEMINLDGRLQRDEDSEQEVFGMDYDDDSAEEEELLEKFKAHNRHVLEPNSDNEEEQDEAGWGSSRNDYYVSDEATDDEAKEEEQEALRLQKKQVETFEEQDFLDDDFENLIQNKLKDVERKEFNLDEAERIQPNLSNLSVKEQMRLLKKNMPDILKYKKEFSVIWEELQDEEDRDEVLFLKYLYLANLAYFLAMAASDTNTRTSHPVVDHLKKFEELVSQSKQQTKVDDVEEDVEDDDVEEEFEDLIEEEQEFEQDVVQDEEGSEDELVQEYKPLVPLKKKKKYSSGAFGEGEDIAEVDLQDKILKKKSLQFHVNRVDQNLLDKNLASKIRAKLESKPETEKSQEPEFNEDEDEHYLNQTEQIYGKLSDNEQEDQDDSDDYYEEVKNMKRKRKEEKEELHAELHKPLEEPFQEDDLEMDVKRKATYKILANRGLTPFRKKENRNPRVKKRMKYDAAKKKLSSVRRVAVDKSKLSKYQGELTGIKSNLSRSTKF